MSLLPIDNHYLQSMNPNTNQNRNLQPTLLNTRLPLRRIPSANQTKNNKHISQRTTTISPRLTVQKENVLLDVASLWDQNSHKTKLKDKCHRVVSPLQNQGLFSQAIQKPARRQSKSRSPTTVPKLAPRPPKPVKPEQNFHCQQSLQPYPLGKKADVIKEITATVKPNFFQKAISPLQAQLAQFEALQQTINCQSQAQQVVYLANQEGIYSINPHYLRRQNKLDWQARAILMEWMMQIHTEFLLKRQTFHLSVNIVDLYLSKINSCVSKKDLQAIGSVAMYIAAKIEEQQPLSIVKIGKCSMDKYTTDTLLQIELIMIKTLNWNLNPPTIDMWANWVMQQWDLFVESDVFRQLFPECAAVSHLNFKKPDQKSYKNYRDMMQLVDCSVVDIQTLQYKPRLLVCSFMYLLLGKHYANFNPKQIHKEFPYSSLYLISDQLAFNSIYSKFIEYTFGFMLLDTLPTIQYCATYFSLPLNYNVPNIDVDNQEISTEEYVTYQTYNPYTMHTIKTKQRNIGQ